MTSPHTITFDEQGLKKAAVLLMSLPTKTAVTVHQAGQMPSPVVLRVEFAETDMAGIVH